MIIERVAGVAAGTAAALRSPLWLRTARLNELLAAPRYAPRRGGDPDLAAATALRVLRLLARLRLPLWRNTCLYQSIAECLVLRRYGVPCRLQIGVAATGASTGRIDAHAWVVRLDAGTTSAPPQTVVLSR